MKVTVPVVFRSVVDLHHVDADPDSTYHPDADPNSTFHSDADPDPSFQIKAQTLEKKLKKAIPCSTF
jgi:hypothetical protein